MLSYVYQGRNSLVQPIEYNHWPRGAQAWFQPVAALENCWLNCTTSINSTDCCWKKLAFSLQVQIPKSQREAHPSQAVLICFPGKFAFLLFLLSFSFLLFSNPVALSQPCPHIPQGKLIFHWDGAYHSNIHWRNKWTTKSSEREEYEGSLWTIRKHFQKNKRQVGCFHKLDVSQIYLNSPFQTIHNC